VSNGRATSEATLADVFGTKDAGLIPNKHRAFVMDTQVKYTVVSHFEIAPQFLARRRFRQFREIVLFALLINFLLVTLHYQFTSVFALDLPILGSLPGVKALINL
jgi:hypothetical protein